MRRERNAVLGIYDWPIYADWLAWLTVLAIVAVVGIQPTLLDLIIAVVFQFLLFGMIPGVIRRSWRRRKAERTTTKRYT